MAKPTSAGERSMARPIAGARSQRPPRPSLFSCFPPHPPSYSHHHTSRPEPAFININISSFHCCAVGFLFPDTIDELDIWISPCFLARSHNPARRHLFAPVGNKDSFLALPRQPRQAAHHTTTITTPGNRRNRSRSQQYFGFVLVPSFPPLPTRSEPCLQSRRLTPRLDKERLDRSFRRRRVSHTIAGIRRVLTFLEPHIALALAPCFAEDPITPSSRKSE